MQLTLFENVTEKNPASPSGKTCRDASPCTTTLSGVFWERWPEMRPLLSHALDLNLARTTDFGAGAKRPAYTFQSGQTQVLLLDPAAQSRGESWMPNISDWPNDAAVCSLSQVLERGSIHAKYFLSAKACAGILRRAEKRGKELPTILRQALQQVAGGLNGGGDSRGQDPVVAVPSHDPACTLTARDYKGPLQEADLSTVVTHTLRAEGFDASEDGTGRGVPLVPIAFDCKASGQNGFGVGEIASTMRARGHADSHANGGGRLAVVFPLDLRNGGRDPEKHDAQNRQGVGVGEDGEPAHTLNTAHVHGVAVALRGREGGATAEVMGDRAGTDRASQGGGDKPYVLTHAVRRLTPRECEALQGFPRGYTAIPGAADGPRYKALGNSMTVPVMAWILKRIDAEVKKST